ncbi:3-phenylpropionate-dihydrodiol/cinnamic acid-dihydrodiol dehydrogenase [Methylobacterium adhaesivum]|uniref:Oxidoreductase n=1 Tax=Methylobacterium adhaesivum TaxID=333297 RepID=A0ABT8BMR5_9HYPH|nr:oxidoreductase [Methylobacterium adhaesivum]MDN3593128.1 oxidoreductase [Methylobacterium adhaesivum]GJD33089.1 3-phenylpropionate-dihydrodiol/cinnamic acid-dihydrodiol dehydrogenase [Methylobacterium adhaesivum]
MSQTSIKTAIVTGAASGIGKATAKALRAAGYRVYGTSRKPAPAADPGVRMLTCDVTDDASVAGMIETVFGEAGRIDLLVNNAGFGISGAAEESSVEQAQAMFDVNLFGVVRTIRAVLPIMRSQKGGRIINISSVQGLIPAPYMALYGASKHAVEGYSESLDHEIRGQGIRVVLVEPAFTRTAFDQNLVRSDTPLDIYETERAGRDQFLREVMTTADTPEVVAKVVVTAATATTPKRRYAAGPVARQASLLRRFVPAKAFDKSFRKQMGLPQVP